MENSYVARVNLDHRSNIVQYVCLDEVGSLVCVGFINLSHSRANGQ